MSEVHHEDEAEVTRSRSGRVLRACGRVAGWAVIASPIAGYVGMETPAEEEILPIGGQRQFTTTTAIDGNIDFDLGPHGTIRLKSPNSHLGANVKVGHVPNDIDGDGQSSKVLQELLSTVFSLDEDAVVSAANSTKEVLSEEVIRNALLAEALLIGLGLSSSRLSRDKKTHLVLASALAISVFAPPSGNAQGPWESVATPFGVIQCNDAVTTELIRNLIPQINQLNGKREKVNDRYIDTAAAQLPTHLDKILADKQEGEILIAGSSDEHSSHVMFTLLKTVRTYLHPDLVTSTGDLVNFDASLETWVAEAVTEGDAPAVITLGNHDGPVIKRALEETDAILPEGLAQVIELEIAGQTVRILAANDPRTTEAGTSGYTEIKTGLIQQVRDEMVRLAQENPDLDIIMTQNPDDLEYLREQGVAASLMYAGDEHVQSIKENSTETLRYTSGSTGGIGTRTITNLLTPFGIPNTSAYMNIARYNPETKSAHLYTLRFDSDANVTMTEVTGLVYEIESDSAPTDVTVPEQPAAKAEPQRNKK